MIFLYDTEIIDDTISIGYTYNLVYKSVYFCIFIAYQFLLMHLQTFYSQIFSKGINISELGVIIWHLFFILLLTKSFWFLKLSYILYL